MKNIAQHHALRLNLKCIVGHAGCQNVATLGHLSPIDRVIYYTVCGHVQILVETARLLCTVSDTDELCQSSLHHTFMRHFLDAEGTKICLQASCSSVFRYFIFPLVVRFGVLLFVLEQLTNSLDFPIVRTRR